MLNHLTCPFIVRPLPDGTFHFQCPRDRCRAAFTGPLPRYYHICGDKDAAMGGPCAHRGNVLRTEQCQSCGGNVRFKVFTCQVHGQCTLAKMLSGIKSCVGCAQYQANQKECER